MKKMNVFLLIAFMLVLIAVRDTESKKMTIEEAKKTVKNLRKVCAKKTDAPKELLDGQHKGEFPKEEKLMCYMRCIMTSTKTMKNDEVLFDWFINNARLMLIEEYAVRVEHAVDACRSSVTAKEGCEAAWQFGKCIYETDSEVIFKHDYAVCDILGVLALPGPVNEITKLQNDRMSGRSTQASVRRRRRRAHRKAAKPGCRNSKTKPYCRRY